MYFLLTLLMSLLFLTSGDFKFVCVCAGGDIVVGSSRQVVQWLQYHGCSRLQYLLVEVRHNKANLRRLVDMLRPRTREPINPFQAAELYIDLP